MFMALVQLYAIHYAMLVNSFGPNGSKTAQIDSSWYEEIAMIDPAQRNSDHPDDYISVVNESSQQLYSLLTLCIRLLQRSVAPVQQWYTAARHPWTSLTDSDQSCLQRSGIW